MTSSFRSWVTSGEKRHRIDDRISLSGDQLAAANVGECLCLVLAPVAYGEIIGINAMAGDGVTYVARVKLGDVAAADETDLSCHSIVRV